jgi:hypothetical protein
MSLSFSCPHCGKQFSVADQYAGQTGPCAACGKTITVPRDAPAAPLAPSAATGSGSGATVAIAVVALIVVLLACTGIPLGLIIPAAYQARSAARRSSSMGHLKQIGLALHNYHDVHGSFPPAVVTDAAGKPLYSGRVLLLPYLEQQALYNSFDKTQAWDSPANTHLSHTTLPVFCDPSETAPRPGQNDYLFVTGKNMLFEGTQGWKFQDITDGTSNTIAVVEAQGVGGNWAEPKEFDLSLPTPLPPGHYAEGNLVLFADGSVQTLNKTLPPSTIHALGTRNGSEVVQLPP